MINLFFCCTLFFLDIYPQNPLWDHYTIIPPIGKIKSIATSPVYVIAISDNYLLFIDRTNFTLEKTVLFDQPIDLLGYDNWTNDLWIISSNNIIRFTISTYSVREFAFPGDVNRFCIASEYLYIDAGTKFSLNKITGELKVINSFPTKLNWYKKISENDVRNYPFLSPFYYFDDPQQSQFPFHRYPISALYDDGMDLYVGTDGFGILKYSKVSWQSKRIIYGPLDSRVSKVKRYDHRIYFLSPAGISYYTVEQGDWSYLRLNDELIDLVSVDNEIFAGINNQFIRISGTFQFPIGDFKTNILSINVDQVYIYIGTKFGLFKIIYGTNEILQFGPDKYAIYAVYPTEKEIYVGGEFAFFRYNKNDQEWLKLINVGVKEIVQIKDEMYLLGVNNQLIRYRYTETDSLTIDTNWILLPYFNIYSIDTDDDVLYCASYAGIYYYDPSTQLYKVIYNLPRIKYDYVFVIDDKILAVSGRNIYSLPIEYRN